MDLIVIIIHAFDHIVTVFSRYGGFLMTNIEDTLAVPLREIGLRGVAVTICVALVPILSLIAVWRFLRGIIRIGFMIVLIIFALHAAWPLTTQLPALFKEIGSSV